jgi:hypothetical protein
MAQSMADSFGARIETRTSEGTALCLVIGDPAPLAAIAAVEGKPVSALGSGRVLALVRLDRLPTLRQQPSVRHAGPVNVDRERLAAFARLTGNTIGP